MLVNSATEVGDEFELSKFDYYINDLYVTNISYGSSTLMQCWNTAKKPNTEAAGDKWWEQVKLANCTLSLSDMHRAIDSNDLYIREERQFASPAW